ncbi:type I polyketide synthase [Gloeobacter morelensis]|uniref:Acyltransferase domain-containing protein n=1 Tax=Gloeobacter morelensis MG652769 TaxID=2781736 RepID=A0ABY3PH10_9CYAN|nr:type I polyketide synthase [Gloeobacter morelensis]UFP92956.1 acyltransferase domain-containing protein [Gloeobacter morelensis MG652769]
MNAEHLAAPDPGDTALQRTPIAIVGLAGIFPQASNAQEYWENILGKIDCLTDVPPSRWRLEDYYDPNPAAPDKTYCRRGGFIPDIDFDPLEFGLPPNILEVTDVTQLLGLVTAKAALADAGYGEASAAVRERTGVILGLMAGSMQLVVPLTARLQYPVWRKVLKSYGLSEADTEKIVERIKLAYVGWEENAYPGYMANVIAGRIANRLDLGGTSCVVDAACASSLMAFKAALSELCEQRCDMVLTGGLDLDNSILTYLNFSKTPAFSKEQQSRPFDADSDGMMVGEGIGMLVLKRLADAERDGDRIYAVVRGVGSSSDGRHKSIYAPRPEGQVRCLQQAYRSAGIAPQSVGLIEAHGTGTNAGDLCEFTALDRMFGRREDHKQAIALGSVKSQIGHTKGAAGAASLIKAALALHHKILPPTINVGRPNPKFAIEGSAFYLNTEARPWVQPGGELPRRAGVSSFGFGGTNHHVVLEEYGQEPSGPYRLHRPAQSVVVCASTPTALVGALEGALNRWESLPEAQAFTELCASSREAKPGSADARLGFVADSAAEARELLQLALITLREQQGEPHWEHPKGIYYRERAASGKVVALFPGQGSQYLNMGGTLTMNFPPLRAIYATLDRLFVAEGMRPVSQVVFPMPALEPEQQTAQQKALLETEYSQAATSALSAGHYRLLREAGFAADFVAGHSFGELTALWAAGVLDEETYFCLVKERGKAMAVCAASGGERGSMLAVGGDWEQIQQEIADLPQVIAANWNSSNQVVLAGASDAILEAQRRLDERGYRVKLLPVAAAFHTPLVRPAQERFAQAVRQVALSEPQVPIFSNATGALYPADLQAIRQTLEDNILQPVLFKQEIENIYAQGGGIFVEFGPKGVLTNLVKDILAGKPHLAVALNPSAKRDSDRQLREAVVQLRVAGLTLAEFDTFCLPLAPPAAKRARGMPIRLGAGNYVSLKTRTAFEQALQEGQGGAENGGQVARPSPQPPTTNGQADQHAGSVQNTAPARSAQNRHHEPRDLAMTQTTLDLQQAFASIEFNLAQFSSHQEQLMQLHRQYLQQQVESTHLIDNLIGQQFSLLSGQKSIPMTEEVLATIERGMQRFYHHLEGTLRSHEQYLRFQSEYTRAFYRLTQQQYALIGEGGQALALPPLWQNQGPACPVPAPALPAVLTNGHNGNNGHEAPREAAFQPYAAAKPVATLEIQQSVPVPAVAAPQPSGIEQALLEIVSDKTGYPIEMIETEMDLEADLSIDSIKRVEILGALQEKFPELPTIRPDDMAELQTLAQIVVHLQGAAQKKN